MPPPPEFLYASGKIRRVKIFHQIKAHDFCRADCYRRISGKITVNLDGKCRGSKHQHNGSIKIPGIKHRIGNHCNPVGNYHFQEIAPQHNPKPAGYPVIIIQLADACLFHLFYLNQKVFRALNRPGNKLREKRDKQCIFKQVFLRTDILPVYIHRIAQRLKRIKRNANRQHDIKRPLQHLQPKPFQKRIHIAKRKIKIFKKSQNAQVACKA